MNKKYISLVFVFLTIILGIVAIFTAWRLQQLRTTAPDKSQAADVVDSCELTTFTITRQESPTPTPTESPTASPTASPTGSPTESPTSSPTASPTATPTSTPIATATPTSTPTGTSTPVSSSTATPLSTPVPTPELPNSGIGLPVIAGIALSTLFILAAVILAL